MKKNPKWDKQQKVIKASQVAFELEQKIAAKIQQCAAIEGLTASNLIKKTLGLSYSIPKRPRLTASLTQEDYEILGKKYNIDADNNLEIKRKIIEELLNNFSD